MVCPEVTGSPLPTSARRKAPDIEETYSCGLVSGLLLPVSGKMWMDRVLLTSALIWVDGLAGFWKGTTRTPPVPALPVPEVQMFVPSKVVPPRGFPVL